MGSRRHVKPFIRTGYESQKRQPYAQTCLDDLPNISLSLGQISDSCLPCSTLHGSHCLSHEFSELAKLALEKQAS